MRILQRVAQNPLCNIRIIYNEKAKPIAYSSYILSIASL